MVFPRIDSRCVLVLDERKSRAFQQLKRCVRRVCVPAAHGHQPQGCWSRPRQAIPEVSSSRPFPLSALFSTPFPRQHACWNIALPLSAHPPCATGYGCMQQLRNRSCYMRLTGRRRQVLHAGGGRHHQDHPGREGPGRPQGHQRRRAPRGDEVKSRAQSSEEPPLRSRVALCVC